MLDGLRVAVLEARAGEQMCELLRRRGAIPVHAPALAEVAEVEPEQIRVLLQRWQKESAALVMFQTGVGTRALFEAVHAQGGAEQFAQLLARSQIAVRGPKPTSVLRAQSVRIDYSAAEPYTTRELIAAVADLEFAERAVFVQRFGESNEALSAWLADKGARMVEIATYRWALPQDLAPLAHLLDELEAERIDAAVFTSASQIHNLFVYARGQGRESALREGLIRIQVFSIGPVCSAALAGFSITVAAEASPPKLGPLMTLLEAQLGAVTARSRPPQAGQS